MFDFDNGAPPSDGYTLMSRLASLRLQLVGLSWCAPYTLSIGSCPDVLFIFLFSNPKYKEKARLVVSGGRLQWNAISHFYGVLLKSEACEPHLLMLQRRNEQMLLPIGLN